MIQESPAFLIPFTVMVESWSGLTVAKTILLAAFLMHYFNRYIFRVNFAKFFSKVA